MPSISKTVVVVMAMRSKASNKKKAFASYLRKHQSNPERKLGYHLSESFPNTPIYRQSLCYGYILDFYVAANRSDSPFKGLAIEVDGPHHLKQIAYDKKRDAILLSKGIKTIRFDTGTISNNLPAVLAFIGFEISKIRN